jgi:hypothetical protein
MIRREISERGFPLLVAIAILLGAGYAAGEELLVKGESKFLGWKTGIDDFKTCKKRSMRIENGKIEKTNQKCEESTLRPTMVRGEVEQVDESKRTVRIRDAQGVSHKVFYAEPGLAGDDIGSMGLKAGDKVVATVPVEGRAERVVREQSIGGGMEPAGGLGTK